MTAPATDTARRVARTLLDMQAARGGGTEPHPDVVAALAEAMEARRGATPTEADVLALVATVQRHQREGTHLHLPCMSDNDCPACRLARLLDSIAPALATARKQGREAGLTAARAIAEDERIHWGGKRGSIRYETEAESTARLIRDRIGSLSAGGEGE